MGFMTDDERFERFLRDAAADYQAPASETPRDAMWDAICARRAVAPAPSMIPVVPHGAPRAARLWVWGGMAATLLLGVAVGRFAWHRDEAPPVATIAPAPAVLPSAHADSAVAPTPVRGLPGRRVPSGAGASLPGARTNTYSLVAARHLADVEALLTSYAVSGTETRSDTMFGRWAKDLLSNTRLLMDSPAARDPVRARLLSDLEVILVQLVQRSPGGDAEERSAVERTLQKTQLIPRLRSAVPASLHSGTD
jgi:hypothetical protein